MSLYVWNLILAYIYSYAFGFVPKTGCDSKIQMHSTESESLSQKVKKERLNLKTYMSASDFLDKIC